MVISSLIKNLTKIMEEHGDIQVEFYCDKCGSQKNVDIVELEKADMGDGRPNQIIVVGE